MENRKSFAIAAFTLVILFAIKSASAETWENFLSKQSKEFKENIVKVNKLIEKDKVLAKSFSDMRGEYAKLLRNPKIDKQLLLQIMDNFKFSLYQCAYDDADCVLDVVLSISTTFRLNNLNNSQWSPLNYVRPSYNNHESIYDEYYSKLKEKTIAAEKQISKAIKEEEINRAATLYSCELKFATLNFLIGNDGMVKIPSFKFKRESSSYEQCYLPGTLKTSRAYPFKTDGNKYTWKGDDKFISYELVKSDSSNSSKSFLYWENTDKMSNPTGLHRGACRIIDECPSSLR
ncbi:hypothetical protein [Limnohabitans sp. Rim8]|uniref:hypothetical protein n=1 Tax=Limnohabitans sp. Rim8 TaxID=1100718 RepID=UPI00262AFE78|nr:hypothetical protein [Limnohabitans sp. Rim8]